MHGREIMLYPVYYVRKHRKTYLKYNALYLVHSTVSVLRREKGYTVKYNLLPEGVPDATPEGKGIYLTVYPESSPNADIILF